MSTQDYQSVNAPEVQKPGFNVYTMMLIISLIMIIVACVLLAMELQLYGNYPWWDTSAATAMHSVDVPALFANGEPAAVAPASATVA